jgi:voltage-gated potassium channel
MKTALRPFYKIYFSLFIFSLILLSGTIGYMAIEGFTFMEALYMTVITLSTVGYSETRPLSNSGRAFTIFLIIINIGTFTYFISLLSSYFLDGEFLKAYKLYKMKNLINELSGHIIICGFGRNGQEAARIFHNNGKDFVAVERKSSRKDNLPFDVKFCLEDDATRDETLIEAGIHRASALITTLPDDADNLFVVLTAHELNPKIKIISRASNDSSVKKLKTAGANNVIMPDKIGGTHMATLVISPDVEEFVDLMATQNSVQFSIAEIESSKTISLEELNCWKNTGATLLGIKALPSEYSLNPLANTIVKPGNRLIVMGSQEQLSKVKNILSN